MSMIHGSTILVLLVFIAGSISSRPLVTVPIGVVLDSNSPTGSMADFCIKNAVSDTYKAHPNYQTRLKLHTKNADTVLDANLAAVDLVKHEEVHGIIGSSLGSAEESFFSELGQRVGVPIISCSVAYSSFSPYNENDYFVKMTPDDSIQAQVLAEIIRRFKWTEVAVLYEDTENGNRFLSHLNKAFQEVEIGLAYMLPIPISAEDSHISSNVLNSLKRKQTRVFVVHASPFLGFRLFKLAKIAGVMSEGYAWLVSYSLSVFMDSIDHITRDSMEGVVGVRPFVPHTKELESFKQKWKQNTTMELNVYGMLAYDAVTALAMTVEKVVSVNQSALLNRNNAKNGTKEEILRMSKIGPQILKELSSIEFRGMSGEFRLVDGKLKPSTVEIFNMVGSGEKTVGFWTPDRGLTKELKCIMWPGDSFTRPKGWAIPSSGFLRVGVPWKLGFPEFAHVTVDQSRNCTNATGFSIDVFLASLDLLPFHVDYKFSSYNDSKNINQNYDVMLHKIPKEYDMVVGDTTIWAPRANFVDFTTPFSESGVTLVVKNKKPFDMWIFMKPLSWDLWLAIFGACIVLGIVLRILEHRVTTNDLDSPRTHKKRRQMIHLSPIAILAFPERNMVSNNWSFIVLVFWLFMAFILMQSYTANLSAILTVDQLKFAFSDDNYIGYQDGSFMKDFMTQHLHISESRLRSYTSAEEYHVAMSKGSKNGGIDAVFDEIPYLKIFLKKYESQYKMVGPTYRTGGFGFAFPLGSPLTAKFSRAILGVTQGPNMMAIEQKNFGPGYSSQDPLSSTISQGTSSLSLYDFGGLFIIIGSVTVFALFCSETAMGRNITCMIGQLANTCFFIRPSKEDSSIDGYMARGREDDPSHKPVVWDNAGVLVTGEGSDARVTGFECGQEKEAHEKDPCTAASGSHNSKESTVESHKFKSNLNRFNKEWYV